MKFSQIGFGIAADGSLELSKFLREGGRTVMTTVQIAACYVIVDRIS
jgi:hypothetical protein